MKSSFYRRCMSFALGLALIGLAAATSPAFGQASAQTALIDRELFFGDPEISGAQISPDGKFICFC